MNSDRIRSKVIQNKIDSILEKNKLDDLKNFLYKRHVLNVCNVWMLYFFYITQSAGILTSSYGVSVNNTKYIWVGVFLNMLASLIQIFEKLNNAQLNRLLNDIQAIKDDKYLDESPFVDLEELFPLETEYNINKNYINTNYLNTNIKKGSNSNSNYNNINNYSNNSNTISNNNNNNNSNSNNYDYNKVNKDINDNDIENISLNITND
jgi:hypothetical protein